MLSIPTLETVGKFSAIFQHPTFLDGMADGHLYFVDTYEDGPLSIDEMTELAEDGLTSKVLESSAKAGFVLEAMETQGMDGSNFDVKALKLDWKTFHREKDERKSDSFMFCLGFIVGVIDRGLLTSEEEN